jgi:hypothetical protein
MSNSPYTLEELQTILSRCELAASGPWKASLEGRDHTSGSSCIVTPSGSIDLDGVTDADIEFIAASRAEIPKLVQELAKFRGWRL